MSGAESVEKYVSERDKFISLVEQSKKDISELIEVSIVSKDLKVKCTKWFEDSLVEFKKSGEQSDIVELARGSVTSLYLFFDYNDPEQNTLFESLRDVILKARNSVLGYKEQ